MCELNLQILSLQPSRSIELMTRAKKMKAQDPDIVDLAGGEPDFDTPTKITEEMIRWVRQGYTHYTVGPGLPELRTRISEKLRTENHCAYSPDEIIVTPGGKYAVYVAVRTLLNPGDEVMYLTPGWVSYPSIITASNGVPVPVNLDSAQNYQLTLEALENRVSEKTKLLIINYPNNPTGRTLQADDLRVLKAFLNRHPNIYVVSDEIYERITYDGHSSISPAADPELADRIITVNGFSKSVAMTGWRIGYLAAPKKIIIAANKLFQHTISCVSGFIQKAAVVAFDCQNDVESMRKHYETRRNWFINELNKIPGIRCAMPQGAFYAWVSFDLAGMNAEDVCEFLLEKAKVVGVPGTSFGEDSAPYVRFSFAASEVSLQQAIINIRSAM